MSHRAAEAKPAKLSTKVKAFVKPPEAGSWPEPYRVDGQAVFHGDPVSHPEHGDGSFGYAEWCDFDGRYLPTAPKATMKRDTRTGQWWAIATTARGGYRCRMTELAKL